MAGTLGYVANHLLFHPVAGERFVLSPGSPACTPLLQVTAEHFSPSFATLPIATDARRDDRAEPASSSPRGFEPPRAQPAWDAGVEGDPKPLCQAPAGTGRGDISLTADLSWFLPLAPSPPQQGLGDAFTVVQFGHFFSQTTHPVHAKSVKSAPCNGLERPEQERRAFVLEIES